MKRTFFLIFFATITMLSFAQTWIWYPGDYEIWLGNQMNNRRTERGSFFPPFWKMDSHYVLVEFSKKIDLAASEDIEIAVEGKFNIKLDGKLQFGMPHSSLPKRASKIYSWSAVKIRILSPSITLLNWRRSYGPNSVRCPLRFTRCPRMNTRSFLPPASRA